VRIGLGAVGDRPVHARAASALLAGTRLEPEAVREAARRSLDEASPASDVRASAEYRRHLIPIYVERVLAQLAAQASGGAGAPGPARRPAAAPGRGGAR
jgi:carbon-monoxide dehydrogenase medium subunit